MSKTFSVGNGVGKKHRGYGVLRKPKNQVERLYISCGDAVKDKIEPDPR
jgi:hypothetical protein